MKNTPNVFISYSHDSDKHKQWVSALATHLAELDLDVILDQWNLYFGGDITRFMEEGIKGADRVLMVCSDKYVEKAINGVKGVGYEGMIVTSELMETIDTNKFIPLIVNQSGKVSLPTFLKTRRYVDFRDQSQYDNKLKELADDIHRVYKNTRSSDVNSGTSGLQQIEKNYKSVGALIFAAGRSTRMQSVHNKMLEPIFHGGVYKPMLAHTVDLYSKLGLDVLVLIGFEGTNVMKTIDAECPNASIKFLRVSDDDGSNLESNTGGTLSKYAESIINILTNHQHILLSVGDQPHMHEQTIRNFIMHHQEKDFDACILTANAQGTELEKCTSTRVSIVPGGLEFRTPPRDGAFDYQSYSPLLDVGVILIKSSCFLNAANKLKGNDVFGVILSHVSNMGYYEVFQEPKQFMNINEPILRDDDDIILNWLEWNVKHNRKSGVFNPFAFGAQYKPIFELDTTLRCATTPACAKDCTYHTKHQNRDIDIKTAYYIIDKSNATGFSGVLFSGGGENLEPGAYDTFMSILKHAKKAGLKTHLATNGVYICDDNVYDLVSNLDSIRFSIACKSHFSLSKDLFPPHIQFSHLGVVGDNIFKVRRFIEANGLSTQIWANVLMSAEMHMDDLNATIMMLSQLGVDGIRLKAKHVYKDGAFHLDPKPYKRHLQEIETIRNCNKHSFPEITISKIDRLLHENMTEDIPTHCWYGDFNPLVVGCDERSYACCEMKYERACQCHHIDQKIDNYDEVLRKNRLQPIIAGKCFSGCKGCLVNRDLQHLLNQYRVKRKETMEIPVNRQIHDRVLSTIGRNSPQN